MVVLVVRVLMALASFVCAVLDTEATGAKLLLIPADPTPVYMVVCALV
jgi:hypothetical protein